VTTLADDYRLRDLIERGERRLDRLELIDIDDDHERAVIGLACEALAEALGYLIELRERRLAP
jgi:hypothetical protein